jgi:hypothetical protein
MGMFDIVIEKPAEVSEDDASAGFFMTISNTPIAFLAEVSRGDGCA